VRIYGHVQGVFFRDSARDEALRLGLSGHVRNLPDGTVELEAEGPQGSLEGLVSWCRHGPPAAAVERAEVEWGEPTARWADFTISG